ncbi:calcium/sodium antiporter [candidate division KSB1 bacterium]|nr:calcium/sodium antiporter [candidate division KSB1 bacterium]RQW00289.1 MAG: calcium/sodium antiporter [candidate division KSB1 bacterium]
MALLIDILLLVVGFVLLIKGAAFLVDGASSLALRFKISPIVIGLTIVSFGTSAPELVVNVVAAIQGNAALSFGNIIGSNIINILLILGIAAIIRPLHAQKGTVWREIPFSLMAVLVLLLMCNDVFFAGYPDLLSRSDGLILLLFFIIFIVYTFGIPKIKVDALPDIKSYSMMKIGAFLIVGLCGLLLGGKIVVDRAVTIARYLGMSDRLIGLTIIAIGTSLPELFTSAVAAFKNKVEIAIGNVVGSNIFNIFFILGLTSFIRPLPFVAEQNIDLIVLLVASVALFGSVFIGRRHRINRWEAAAFLTLYVAYAIFLFNA